MLFQLRLEALEQRKRISRAASKTGEDFFVVNAAYFARGRLHHYIAERDLPIAAKRNGVAAPYGKYGRTVENFRIHWYCRKDVDGGDNVTQFNAF